MNNFSGVEMIAVDLDDTLLRNDLSVSDDTVSVLNALMSLEIKIVIASGRSPESVRHYASRIGIDGAQSYLICHNGSLVLSSDGASTLLERRLASDVALEAFSFIEKSGLPCHIYENGELYVSRTSRYSDEYEKFTGRGVIIPDDFSSFAGEGHFKLVAPGEPAFLESLVGAFKDAFRARATVFISKPFYMEILPWGAGKGEALREVAENFMGLRRSQVMAFGDSMNDESMMRYAYHSVAMSNARPEILALSRHVTEKSNDEDGIAHFLRKSFL